MVVGAIGLRPAEAADQEFLLAVYAGTRADELSAVSWTTEQKLAFLWQQSHAQGVSYRQSYPDDDFAVITEDGHPVGRVFVGHLSGEIRIADIAVLPEARGRGIGTAVISGLMHDARERGVPLTLYVEEWNPARRLYARLGFRETGGSGLHLSMAWDPQLGPESPESPETPETS